MACEKRRIIQQVGLNVKATTKPCLNIKYDNWSQVFRLAHQSDCCLRFYLPIKIYHQPHFSLKSDRFLFQKVEAKYPVTFKLSGSQTEMEKREKMLSLFTRNLHFWSWLEKLTCLKLFPKKPGSQNWHNVISKRYHVFLRENYLYYINSILKGAKESLSKWVFFNQKGIIVNYLKITFWPFKMKNLPVHSNTYRIKTHCLLVMAPPSPFPFYSTLIPIQVYSSYVLTNE